MNLIYEKSIAGYPYNLDFNYGVLSQLQQHIGDYGFDPWVFEVGVLDRFAIGFGEKWVLEIYNKLWNMVYLFASTFVKNLKYGLNDFNGESCSKKLENK